MIIITTFLLMVSMVSNLSADENRLNLRLTNSEYEVIVTPQPKKGLDLGVLVGGGKKMGTISLTNASNSTLLVEGWRSPCDCLTFKETVSELKPGKSKTAKVELDGENYLGRFTKRTLLSFRFKDGDERTDYFLPVRFDVVDEEAEVPRSRKETGDRREAFPIRFVDYVGGGLERHPEAAAWVFAASDCPGCNFMKRELLPKLFDGGDGEDKPVVVVVDLDVKSNFLFFLDVEKKHGSEGGKTPVLLWKDTLYYGNEKVKELIGAAAPKK